MNTLVQEDKIRFASPVAQFAANGQFMAMVFEAQRSSLTVRHLYDQSFADFTTKYEHSIASVHISASNHLVVVTETNQVDIVLVEASGEIKATSVKAFQKKGLVDVAVGENAVGMLAEGKLHLLELRGNACVSNHKYDLGGTPLKGVFVNDNIYVALNNSTIKKWAKAVSGKYEESQHAIEFKQVIAEIKGIRNNGKDYLVCLTKEHQISVISEDGKAIDLINYEGEFKKMVVVCDVLLVVSRVKEADQFALFYAQPDYSPEQPRPFFNKAETYVRNTLYRDYLAVPIAKKEWSVYSRRKGAQEVVRVKELSEEALLLVFAKLESDGAKLELLKIDALKVVNKDRMLNPISRYKQQQVEEVNRAKPSFSHHEVNHPGESSRENSRKDVLKESRQPITVIKKMELSDSCLKAVEKIVDERIAPVIDRIGAIEKKLGAIEAKIAAMNGEEDLARIYGNCLEKAVYSLFESKIVPRMEQYFQAVFADLAQVFSQGIEYYNRKLVHETELQKSTFKSLLDHTLAVTKEIVEANKGDLPYSMRIDQLLSACVQKKDQLLKKTEELLVRVENGPFSYKQTGEVDAKQGTKQQAKQETKHDAKQKEEEKIIRPEDIKPKPEGIKPEQKLPKLQDKAPKPLDKAPKPEEKSLKSDEKKKKTFVKASME